MRVSRGKFRCAGKSSRVISMLISGSQAKKWVAQQAASLVSPRSAAASARKSFRSRSLLIAGSFREGTW
jgi:hypothetical protein